MGKIFKIALLLLVILAISAGVYLVVFSGPTRLGSRAGGFEEVMLFLLPSELRAKQGEAVNLSLKIDTGRETVSGGKILVNFDPLFLSLDGSVKEGSVFKNLTNQIKRGQVVLDCQGEILGQGTIATFSFRADGRGESRVEIDSSSVIWDEGGQANILGRRAGAKVVVE